jgi:hypothetical protein
MIDWKRFFVALFGGGAFCGAILALLVGTTWLDDRWGTPGPGIVLVVAILIAGALSMAIRPHPKD